ncbi:hypothetical protein BJY04DRAFT_99648 [Aspergillus karnatakaensis]|uniref:lytic polysaccharide monooxygenase AA11 family protein n=1 Tax=Aspergillus karnatakaensis TaxID=1810916 RepID=UPI003CCCE752
MICKTSLVAAALFGASLVKGHAIMVNPVPYNFKSWDNSPILEDGSNFPCKETDYTVTTENYLAKGQTHHVEFQGGATHGGGSCQISITSDRAPTKDTQWSVIKSIEGGCMDTNEGSDNLGSSAAMKTPFSPGFTIPDSFAEGEYTLAWTWFNRIGNREMYMNCAPITVTGGSSKRSEVSVVEKRQSESFPPLFIANINGCKLKETKSVRFPNPGSDVESMNEANLLESGADVCNEGSPTWGDAGYSSGGGSAPEPTASEPAATSTTEPAVPTTTASPSISVGIGAGVNVPDFTTTTAPEPVPTQPTEPVVTQPTPTTFTSVAPVPTSAPAPSAPSTSGALSGPCTEEGEWHCISGSAFQRCASGNWTEAQALAMGTECTPGQNKNFAVKAIEIKSRMMKEKRSRRLAHGHAKIHS